MGSRVCCLVFIVVGLVNGSDGRNVDPISFNSTFGSSMVLQAKPQHAVVHGVCDSSAMSVTLSVIESGNVIQVVNAMVNDGLWRAELNPLGPGGDFNITATDNLNHTATLQHVTFGDVWYCGGQSNMALPLEHTLSRNISISAIGRGKYSNIRISGMNGNMNPLQPWSTLKDAVRSGTFLKYSSTCYYFAESLTDRLGSSAPPIGLIHTAWGGSTIEQWLANDTISGCKNATLSPTNQQWHDSRVMPYVSTTVKGWVWYQAENDMHGVFGNVGRQEGYSCLMSKLVMAWRDLWTSSSDTAPQAPFGLVTLAPSGSEGGNDIGTMRWAQTASYGVLPNPALPNTFLAQGYDLGDPFSNITCYKKGCCAEPTPAACDGCNGPGQYCESLAGTNYYMGPIHPRDKKVVGDRLAQACVSAVYGKGGAVTGPTLSGCHLNGSTVILSFNKELLKGDSVIVQPYNTNMTASKMQVLVNASLFCMQTVGRGAGMECIDDGMGRDIGTGAFDSPTTWVSVDIVGTPSPSTVAVDLGHVGGAEIYAIRYAWTGSCCSENPPTSEPCPVASCPLMSDAANLPANPFVAHIVNGKCRCVSPQTCDE